MSLSRRHFYFVTIHPEFIKSYFEFGVFRSAASQKIAEFTVVNLRDFAVDHRGSVDDRPYGGGDGMIMCCEPLMKAVRHIETQTHCRAHVILLSPGGEIWASEKAKNLAASSMDVPQILICGRFAGIDQRFIDMRVDEEYSIGDYTLSGGEIPALAIVDTALRWVPGVLGDEQSAKTDSFGDAGSEQILKAPQYTKPPIFEGRNVPEELISGNHSLIAQWRLRQSKERTKMWRQKRRVAFAAFAKNLGDE